jgi:hypothetical protein
VKLHATFHLLNSFIFICILLQAFLTLPMVWAKEKDPAVAGFFEYAALLTLPLGFVAIFFFISRIARWESVPGRSALAFIWQFPMFLIVSSGLSLHNAIATMEGYMGIRSPFIRTPKFNLRNLKDSWRNKQYSSTRISLVTILEGVMALYFASAIGFSFYWDEWGMLPYLLMLFAGYALVFWYSLRHARTS